MLPLALSGLATTAGLMFAAWLVSLPLRNVAIVGTFWGLAVAGAGVTWLLLTVLLLKVSGVALTEKDIASRRPEYRDCMRRTSAFVPRMPRA